MVKMAMVELHSIVMLHSYLS